MMNRIKLDTPLKIIAHYRGEKIFEHVFDECPIVIGRSAKCDVPLTSVDFLSRQHCSVTIEDSKISVVDLDSANGMFFNGVKVKQAVIEDVIDIEIGELTLHFQNMDISEQETVVEEVTKIKFKPMGSPLPEPTMKTNKSIHTEPEPKPEPKAAPEPIPAKIPKAPRPVQSNVVIPVAKPTEKHTEEKSNSKIKMPKKNPKPAAHSHDDHGAGHSLHASQHTNSTDSMLRPHTQSSQLRPQQRVLESYVLWKDQIYDLTQSYPGQNVVIGQGNVDLEVPILKKPMRVATFDGNTTQVFIPQNVKFEFCNENKTYTFEEAVLSSQVQKKSKYYSFKLGASDVVTIQLSHDMSVHFRYVPTPRQLSRTVNMLGDRQLKTKAFVSGVVHFALFLSIILTEPKSKVHIKNVPDRYARLIVKPPEPKKPEPPKPEPKKVAEKKPEPKKIAEKKPKIPKVVKLEKSKVLAKVNKYPVEVKKVLKVAEKPVVANIQAVGALAALNAFSSKTPPSDTPVAININKNAGGQTALNTGGVIGALKTSSGKLAAGGLASVKTKGLGYGTGSGYGVQGIKGTAGGRSIAGTVVGAPQLVHLSKEEGLNRSQVMEVVKRHMGEIQQCYERSLIDNAKLSGRVEYEWAINANGSVSSAHVKKSEVANGDGLNNCVTEVFKKMKFPVATNGQSTTPNIGFPFGRM